MRVLVLRPAAEAERTAARLVALGHEPALAPLLEIVPTQAQAPREAYDALAATSAHALRCLNASFDALRSLPLFVVGGRTAAAARARGFSNIGAVEKDAASLLNVLLGAARPSSRVLYLAGNPRRPELENGAAQAGLDLRALTIYEARAATRLPRDAETMIRAGELDAALHYSERSAALFLELVRRADLAAQASRFVHIAISEQASAPLRGFARDLRVAAAPDETALLALVKKMG